MTNPIQPLLHLKALLQIEHDTERETYRLQSQKMSLARRVRRGICWHPIVVGRNYYNSLNQLVVEITQTEPQDIEHNFEYGRPVMFFVPGDGGKDNKDTPVGGASSSCTVSYADEHRMVVVVPSVDFVLRLEAAEDLAVQLYFDETSYRCMYHALDEAINARHGRLAELRSVFAGETPPRCLSLAPMTFPWLNASQTKAVNEVLCAQDVAIVHGPPGTGKTTTLVEAVYETLRRETQVLVCAQSNAAVNWISAQLVDHGVPVLRIGNPARATDKMLSFTYERQFEAHPDYPQLWAIRRNIRTLRENRTRRSASAIASLREKAQEIEMRIHASLFDNARVVAATLVGTANKLMVGRRFSTLFIDEAAQALEPACWIAIRRAGRVVLAGDHQQLPPTVKSYDAMRQGLGVTLMERVAKEVPEVVTLLLLQYRMNEDIMQFSSQYFYNGAVESAPSVRHRSILDLDTPIEWIDTSILPASHDENFRETFVGEDHGRINRREALLTLVTLHRYVRRIGIERLLSERLDIGIITPYRLQAQYLRTLIGRSASLRRLRTAISVGTVDGFQGQERDIVLISLVRSNDEGQIGFLADLRRMNVAMTRARMKLLIIGDAATLTRHKFYHQLKAYIDRLHQN